MLRNNLQCLVLSHWLGKVRHLLDLAPHLVCHHIYREFNSHADDLSKMALFQELGLIFWKEITMDGTIVEGSLSCI